MAEKKGYSLPPTGGIRSTKDGQEVAEDLPVVDFRISVRRLAKVDTVDSCADVYFSILCYWIDERCVCVETVRCAGSGC